jgi:predicted nucleic acid-binding protein
VRTFVDTSALYALLDEDDTQHAAAVKWLGTAGSEEDRVLVTHNYVILEVAALVYKRLGRGATKVLFDAFVQGLSVFFVDESLHRRAVAAHLVAAGGLSLVDCTSFELMRDLDAQEAFTFGSDFRKEGFETVP